MSPFLARLLKPLLYLSFLLPFSSPVLANDCPNKDITPTSAALNSYTKARNLPGLFGRDYTTFIPPNSANQPLIVLLHPAGSYADSFLNYIKLKEVAFKNCFSVLAPQSRTQLVPYWNSGAVSPKVGLNQEKPDDVKFIADTIAAAKPFTNHNEDRIYLLGMSSGGGMAYRMACERADLFAGLAVVAGGENRHPDGLTITDLNGPNHEANTYECGNTLNKRRPSHPMPLLIIHGTEDGCFPYNGGPLEKPNEQIKAPAVDAVEKEWALFNGCDVPSSENAPTLSDNQPQTTTSITCTTRTACDGIATVKRCKMPTLGHKWPGAAGGTAEVISSVCKQDQPNGDRLPDGGHISDPSVFGATLQAVDFLIRANNFNRSDLSNFPRP